MRTALGLGLFCVLVGVSFSSGHLAGLAWRGRLYTPLIYNTWVLRGVGSAGYFHKFDHWLWDETNAYARYTHEALRGEWLGNTVQSYQEYVKGGLPPGTFWYKDRLGPILLAQVARLFSLTVPSAFLAADFLFPALLAACLLLLGRRLFPFPRHWVVATSLVVWFGAFDVMGLLYQMWGAPH
ncbi:MAG: hypothetical protein HY238_04970, partial [Acidobacteria bacterium]|nr:hypothetical protein [Acidobacteriota bacterium]